MPARLGLSRRKSFDLQVLSHAKNGLPAVVVARPSKCGSTFRVGVDGMAKECIERFRRDLDVRLAAALKGGFLRRELVELRGCNLACWCKPGQPSNADVLLELANR